jgi:hypothetical protein
MDQMCFARGMLVRLLVSLLDQRQAVSAVRGHAAQVYIRSLGGLLQDGGDRILFGARASERSKRKFFQHVVAKENTY